MTTGAVATSAQVRSGSFRLRVYRASITCARVRVVRNTPGRVLGARSRLRRWDVSSVSQFGVFAVGGAGDLHQSIDDLRKSREAGYRCDGGDRWLMTR